MYKAISKQRKLKGDRSKIIRLFSACILAVIIISISSESGAYKLRPTGSKDEKRIVKLETGYFGVFEFTLAKWLNNFYSSPVHEELTRRIWGCKADFADDKYCLDWKYDPQIGAVIYGVQWNDNPPFALAETQSKKYCKIHKTIRLPDLQPMCWALLYYDAEKNARGATYYHRRSGKALIYRVHFGDMQFLHSMASWDGEKMKDTKNRIMMWAEFAYKTALGKISVLTEVQRVPVQGFEPLFRGNGYNIKILFTRGLPTYRRKISLVAFGSLLHMIQDGFSESHVTRDPPSGACPVFPDTVRAGRIIEFHAFNRQDFDKHGNADSRKSMIASLIKNEVNALTVGKKLKELFEAKTSWETVRRYLDECVYYFAPDYWDNPAGPSENYIRK